MKFKGLRKFGFEFLSIFIAVLSAFGLNNWNENRKARNAENKILIEIAHGLEYDLEDLKLNQTGHEQGVDACMYFAKVLADAEVNVDSFLIHYMALTRDFISIQNVGGYEALKSRGLELIENDKLRHQIINLYEYDYNTLRKFEEEYSEMQYHQSYFKELNDILSPNFIIDSLTKQMTGIDMPLTLSDGDRKKALVYVWKVYANRAYILNYYKDITQKVASTRKAILKEVE